MSYSEVLDSGGRDWPEARGKTPSAPETLAGIRGGGKRKESYNG